MAPQKYCLVPAITAPLGSPSATWWSLGAPAASVTRSPFRYPSHTRGAGDKRLKALCHRPSKGRPRSTAATAAGPGASGALGPGRGGGQVGGAAIRTLRLPSGTQIPERRVPSGPRKVPDAQWLLTEHFWKGEEGRPWWVRTGSGVTPESAAGVAAQCG